MHFPPARTWSNAIRRGLRKMPPLPGDKPHPPARSHSAPRRHQNPAAVSLADADKTTVVCVHGFLGSRLQFFPIASRLRKSGFRVLTYSYHSRSKTALQHAAELVDVLRERAGLREGDPVDSPGQRPISFVTHSFGGVVLRCALAHPDCPASAKRGRTVLVAPPLRGSTLARTLAKYPYLGAVTRLTLGSQSGADFTDREADDFEKMGNVMFPKSAEYLLVVGNMGRVNPALTGSSDGILCMQDSRLSQPHRRMVIRGTHNIILVVPHVISSIVRFVQGDNDVGKQDSGL